MDKKKDDVQDFWNAPSVMFLNFQKNEFLWVFLGFFLTKKSLILSALKQKIVGEIRLSNGIKPPKNLLSQDICKFLPHKQNFWWKVSSKMIYTFYWKHQKYSFCAPIFHTLSQTESLGSNVTLDQLAAG